MNQYKKELFEIIKKNRSLVMLAPSFPVDFEYPNVIGMLKKLGFDKVTELTFGARMVNYSYAEYIKNNLKQKYFIASPCPTVVSFISTKYPELKKYLIPVTSPMGAMARIYKSKHKNHKIVFASPCYAKKIIEAPRYKEIDYVITFKDLKEILDEEKIFAKDFSKKYKFGSLIREYTKIYPISGGLSQTAHIKQFFKPEEIFVGEELNKIAMVLDDIKIGKSKYKFFDLLSCPGGCIGGPGISDQKSSTDKKRKKILDYKELSEREKMGDHEGKVEQVRKVDFSYKF